MTSKKTQEPANEEQMTTKEKQTFIHEFIAFIKGFGVIGLALGVVIGGATNQLVQSLSTNIITPLIGLIFNVEEFSTFAPLGIGIGAFVASLVNFIILMFIIWLSIKIIIGRFLSDEEKAKVGIK